MPDPLRLIRLVRARVRALVHRDAVADEIQEELEFHLQMRTQEYRRNGDSEEEAARRARRRVGNLARLQDQGYDIRGGGFLETVVQDIRYGARQLSTHPGFTMLTTMTLALGIGLSTALFSVIDAAMLHPLPYPRPEDLVQILINSPQSNGRIARLSPSLVDVRAIRSSGHVLKDIGSWRPVFQPLIVDGPEPERVKGMEIDEGYLAVYGVRPIMGRGIEAGDTNETAAPVVLVGYDWWERRHGGSRDVVGALLRFDTGPVTIVGVLPPGFQPEMAIFRPLKLTGPMASLRGSGANVMARLHEGMGSEQAARDLTQVISRESGMGAGETVLVRSQLENTRASYQTTVRVLSGAVALILLIGCVNVAGLLLARGTVRLSEFAIRASIGAGRSRLVRQLLTETLMLSLAGGAVGVLLAQLALGTLVANIPMTLPADAPATLNIWVLAMSLALSVIVGLVFGLMPALRITRQGALELLQGGRAGSPLSRRYSSVLLAIEVSLAIVLLAGAALMLRSFGRMMSVDLGFDPNQIVTLEAQTIDSNPLAVSQYYQTLLERVRALPGVRAAGAIDQLPLGPSSKVTRATGAAKGGVAIRTILPGYFEAIGLPLKEGRLPTQTDALGAVPTAVIDEAAAKRLFPDGSPLGRQVTLAGRPQPLLVIGVVGNVRFWGPLMPSDPEVFQVLQPGNASTTTSPRALTVVVRPSGTERSVAAALYQVALDVGPRVLISPVRNGASWLQETVITPRRRTVLLSLLGSLGLLLTLVGIFGMTAYAVTRRTREIGVRIAMGATERDVVMKILTDTAKPLAVGIVVGLAGAALATRLIASFLFETTPTDPSALALATLTIGVAACLAAWIPARRALRIDPVSALRTE
jgi:predicted permease